MCPTTLRPSSATSEIIGTALFRRASMRSASRDVSKAAVFTARTATRSVSASGRISYTIALGLQSLCQEARWSRVADHEVIEAKTPVQASRARVVVLNFQRQFAATLRPCVIFSGREERFADTSASILRQHGQVMD